MHDSAHDVSTSPDAPAQLDGIAELRRGLNKLQRMLGSRKIQARLSEAVGLDITQQAVQVLRVVCDGKPRSVAYIAAERHMDVAAVSGQFRSLEDQQLLTRRASPDHGSVVIVEATAAGRELAERLEDVQRRHFSEALHGWTDEQCGELGLLMQRLVDDLQRTPYRDR